MTDFNRRSLITGLISLVAAPAIIRAANLMPINSSLVPDAFDYFSVPLFWAEIDTTMVRFADNMLVVGPVTIGGHTLIGVDGRQVKAGELIAGETYEILFGAEVDPLNHCSAVSTSPRARDLAPWTAFADCNDQG